MELQTAKRIHDALYAKVDGMAISQRNSWAYKGLEHSLVYGEINPEGFSEALSRASPREGEVFYDLGSGSGKAVILASLLFGFSRVVGIELVAALGDAARLALERFNREFRPGLPEPDLQRKIEFIDGSFLEHDFSSADVVFTHSTLFPDEMWAPLVSKLEGLKPGARVLCADKEIAAGGAFIRKEAFAARMAWGFSRVSLYERR